MTTEAIRPADRHKPWYRILYVQVLIAIALGILIGNFFPDLGKSLKPLGDGFIALIKMMIAPVIFCTVVHGISSMGDLKRVGRVGLKSLVYFETVSTVALGTGNAVVEVPRPGGLKERVVVAPDVPTLRRIAQATGGSFSAAPDAARLESVYRELGTRLARDRKQVEVTSAFAAGGAVLMLVGSALSSLWFRRVL